MLLPATGSHGDLGCDAGGQFRVDQGLHEGLLVGEDQVSRDGADAGPFSSAVAAGA